MTNINSYLKFASCLMLFGLWTGLVVTGHKDADLIEAIKYALGALGFYHALVNLQGTAGYPAAVAQQAPPPAGQKPAAVSFPPPPKEPQ
jgi:hypothetical protein